MPREGERKKAVGRIGEEVAVRYLESRGFRVLARNWRGPTGELDIIAEDGETLVFVEVRTRSRPSAVAPSEWFPISKRRKLLAAAWDYPSEDDRPRRFDVIGVTLGPGLPKVAHYPAAFGEEGS
ncbi:MAG: YraN family protein [Fimbriimonadia bacterium]